MPYVIDNPKPTKYIPLAMILSTIGLGGLIYLIFSTQPTLGPRWLFFFLLMFAGTGLALLPCALLNYYFPAKAPATQKIIMRQASWFGIYASIIFWLMVGRVFSLQLATAILFGFVVLEVILRVREIAIWNANA